MHKKKAAKRVSMEEVTILKTGITIIQTSELWGRWYCMVRDYYNPNFGVMGSVVLHGKGLL